ncbi:MAG: hypothetical protein ACI87O_001854 [Planctomycetota bacterium]|jgi:hypothetical protein
MNQFTLRICDTVPETLSLSLGGRSLSSANVERDGCWAVRSRILLSRSRGGILQFPASPRKYAVCQPVALVHVSPASEVMWRCRSGWDPPATIRI